MPVNSRLPGFYKLTPEERFDKVLDARDIEPEAIAALRTDDADLLRLADGMVENVVGVMPLPLGVGANFCINGKDYLVPMATEEPSVVAAAAFLRSRSRRRASILDCSELWTLWIYSGSSLTPSI